VLSRKVSSVVDVDVEMKVYREGTGDRCAFENDSARRIVNNVENEIRDSL